ncbi:hypothetical protein GQ53DRAFT_471793 [Thozetella sp. PMI_491]|nr:hypothetical protein GQ53DRAFT_471793 [Thozetella sp. PMI_491]
MTSVYYSYSGRGGEGRLRLAGGRGRLRNKGCGARRAPTHHDGNEAGYKHGIRLRVHRSDGPCKRGTTKPVPVPTHCANGAVLAQGAIPPSRGQGGSKVPCPVPKRQDGRARTPPPRGRHGRNRRESDGANERRGQRMQPRVLNYQQEPPADSRMQTLQEALDAR